MADLTDVGAALQALVAQALYPAGTGNPSAAGAPVKVYQGWPIPQLLDADLKIGTCHVSIYPRPEERNTTRYPRDWQALAVNVATLTATIAGQAVIIGGTPPAADNPTNIAVEVNGLAFVYAVQAGDTLRSIATGLAALIAVGVPGTVNSGPAITFPATARIASARVGVTATSIRELRRQQRQFQITIWADTPDHRDAIVRPVDAALAAVQFLTMPDTFAARLIYHGSPISDGMEKAGLFRRDLIYSVEYATTDISTATQVTQQQINVTATNAAPTTINM